MKRLVTWVLAAVALGGCQLFVSSDQGCNPDSASPCAKSGYVCDPASLVCVLPDGGSGSSSGSGSASGSSGSSGGSSGSSGGFGRYGAASFAIPPEGNGGPPTPYFVGGSVGDPKGGTFESGAFEIVDAGGISVVATGASLQTARRHAMAAFFGGGVLVIGGESSPGELASSAELSPTVPGGALASFTSSGAALNTNRLGGSMVFVPPPQGTTDTFLYVVGGTAPGNPSALDSEAAPVTGQTLGAFASIGSPLARAFLGVVQSGKALYAAGGAELYPDGGFGVAKSVLSAALLDDGGLGAWTDTGAATAGPHVDGAVYEDVPSKLLVVAGGLTDILGPNHQPQAVTAIEVAHLYDDGGLSGFEDGGNLATGRGGFVGGVLGATGYAIGGVTVGAGGVGTTDSIETYTEPN